MSSLRNILHKINKAFNRELTSSKVAKDRLKIIITQDRFDIDYDTMHGLQEELIAVLAKHFDFADNSVHVSLKNRGNSYVLVADFPHSEPPNGN